MTLDATKQALLRTINRKGWEVAQKLAEVKGRQDVDLSQLDPLLANDTREPPEVRLRRYLDQINAARTRLQGEGYGLCLDCGTPLGEVELAEMPWLERCKPCDLRLAAGIGPGV